MAKGALQLNLFYPGRIGMPERYGYLVKVRDLLGSVLLHKHLKVVEVLDFNNCIEEDTEPGRVVRRLRRPIESLPEHDVAIVADGELVYVMDRDEQYYRVFRPREFTELFIVHEVQDTGAVTGKEREFYRDILDAFLSAYRRFSQDVAVRMPDNLVEDFPVIRAALHEYSAEELQLPECKRIVALREAAFGIHAVPLGANPRTITPPTFDPELIGPRMSTLLATGTVVPPAQDLLIKALEELKVNGNSRYAFLLAFFAAEQVITELLGATKIQLGVSAGKLKEYEKEVGISYMINVELPMVLPPDHPIRKLIPDLAGVNTIRNAIVHKSREVNYSQAASAINTVSKFIDLLP